MKCCLSKIKQGFDHAVKCNNNNHQAVWPAAALVDERRWLNMTPTINVNLFQLTFLLFF